MRRTHGRSRCLRRRDHFDHGRRRGRCSSQFLACGVVERSARPRCQLLLLRREPGRGRGRRGARDDGPLEHAGRRLVALCGGATNASLGRSHGGHERHRPADIHLRGDPHRRLGYRLRLHERGGRNGDDGAGHLLVGVDDIGHVRVVVIVVDDGVVDHRVAAVDVRSSRGSPHRTAVTRRAAQAETTRCR